MPPSNDTQAQPSLRPPLPYRSSVPSHSFSSLPQNPPSPLPSPAPSRQPASSRPILSRSKTDTSYTTSSSSQRHIHSPQSRPQPPSQSQQINPAAISLHLLTLKTLLKHRLTELEDWLTIYVALRQQNHHRHHHHSNHRHNHAQTPPAKPADEKDKTHQHSQMFTPHIDDAVADICRFFAGAMWCIDAIDSSSSSNEKKQDKKKSSGTTTTKKPTASQTFKEGDGGPGPRHCEKKKDENENNPNAIVSKILKVAAAIDSLDEQFEETWFQSSSSDGETGTIITRGNDRDENSRPPPPSAAAANTAKISTSSSSHPSLPHHPPSTSSLPIPTPTPTPTSSLSSEQKHNLLRSFYKSVYDVVKGFGGDLDGAVRRELRREREDAVLVLAK